MKFKKVEPSDMPVIWHYLQMETGRTTDFSYGGFLMWIEYFKYEYCIHENTLYIKGVTENDRDVAAFSLPIGQAPFSESIKPLKEYCKREGLKLIFSAIPEYAIPEIAALSPVQIEELTDWADYLYDSVPLSTVAGKKMEKKRNHVHQFQSHYPGYRYEALTSKNTADAKRFMDIFEKEGDNTEMAKAERELSRFLISQIEGGDEVLRGGILYVGDDVAGYTIGDIKRDTLFVHVEKASRKYVGSYEMINYLFAKEICEGNANIKYINREDDAGDEGLRLAKESYHPLEKLKKYNVIF